MQAHAPEIVTKALALNRVGDRRRVRVSTNFLPLLGFGEGDRLAVEPLPGRFNGFVAKPDLFGTHKVHVRSYKHKRTNKPHEAVVEFADQQLMDDAFPGYVDRFHVEMRRGLLRFTPMQNRAFEIMRRFKKASPWNAFVALTGGVDVHCMESVGFKTQVVVEHRPAEARDIAAGRDLSEVHALNCTVNGRPRIVINEDLHHIEIDRLQRLLQGRPPISTMHFSLGCDDHSNAKSKAAKAKSLEDLSTMVDQIYPALRQIEAIQPAVVIVENVPAFGASQAGQIMATTLRRWGYHVSAENLLATEHGGVQTRRRHYMVASVWPGFSFPEVQPQPTESIWPMVEPHLADCRDVTDTSSIQQRQAGVRGKPNNITTESTTCPTVMKSQSRGVKDAVYVEHEGRILAPSAGLIRDLMSIPRGFDSSWMAVEQEFETLGQSIDYAMHHRVMEAVRDHIRLHAGQRTVATARMTPEAA